jgi:predicted CXXCH cytochrome family protein
MTQLADARTVQAKFDHVVLTNNGTRFSLSTRSNELWVRMEKAAAPSSDAVQPGAVEAPISLVTGSHHMQVFWLPNGMGNCQIGFPFTWLIPEQRWVPRNSTFLRPPDADHKSETWNIVCSRCHTTGPEPHLNRQERSFATQVAEFGISCEACHGPAARHVAMETDRRTRGLPRKEAGVDHAIVHPEKLEPARTSQVCAFCHSMKWYDRNEGWAETGFRFRPGDDLEATTPVIRPRHLDQQPWLNRVLAANPDLLKDFFWNDGMIRVSGREFNGLIESPCYKGGKFTCLSCHSLHSSEPDDQLARDRTDNRACIQCHPKFGDTSALAAHTHHKPASSGSECYNCHMPHTTYGVLSAIRSHEISSPRVADALKTGRPDACTLCHLDQTLQWTATRLNEWYRQPVPAALPEGSGQIAESVRLALTGDAGQRALITWHLGWEPALRASGVNRGAGWTEPILGQLLDDPYAAIRCLAERSLRQSGSVAPAGYDYTVALESRAPARVAVWNRWAGALINSAADSARARRVLEEAPRDMSTALAPWLARRIERPMRLRE